MSDRQGNLFQETSHGREARDLRGILTAPPRRPIWKLVALGTTGLGTLFGMAFYVWANLGHLFFQPQYTFPVVFGVRQGLTAGEAERAAAPKKAEALNFLNRETARSEADKQAVVLRETTKARADQEAEVRATTVSRNAALEAAAECVRRIRSEAALRRAQCIGTGTAGAECDARGDLIEETESQCGSLAIPSSIQTEGEQP